jgi:hypothetical protein
MTGTDCQNVWKSMRVLHAGYVIMKRIICHTRNENSIIEGIVMSLYALLRNNPRPTEHEVEEAFDGNILHDIYYRDCRSFLLHTRELVSLHWVSFDFGCGQDV